MSKRNGVNATHRSGNRNGNGRAHAARLTVRPARRGDLVPLSFFFDTVLRRDYFMRRGQLKELLNGEYHQVYVAEIDAVLVGVAITTCGSRLVNALVHPAYRGLGIGKALIERSGATEARAKLDMSSGNPLGFYYALGFVSTGERNEKGNIEVLRVKSNRSTDRVCGQPGGPQNGNRKRVPDNGAGSARAKSRK